MTKKQLWYMRQRSIESKGKLSICLCNLISKCTPLNSARHHMPRVPETRPSLLPRGSPGYAGLPVGCALGVAPCSHHHRSATTPQSQAPLSPACCQFSDWGFAPSLGLAGYAAPPTPSSARPARASCSFPQVSPEEPHPQRTEGTSWVVYSTRL